NENTRCYWFNKNSLEEIESYRLLGIILGLGIYNGVLLDIHFPKIVYKKLINYNNVNKIKYNLEDIYDYDPLIGKSINDILHYNIQELCLTFSVDNNYFGKIKTYELIKNGNNIFVNNENKQQYCNLLIKYHL